jgi:hypothetical protein
MTPSNTYGTATSAQTSAPANCHHSSHVSRPMVSRMARYLITALFLLLPATAWAQSGTFIPAVPGQWFDNNGDPCTKCLLYSYASGTDTPQDTFTTAALSVANANPVVLDTAGRATVYLSATTYKFILKSAAGSTIWTRDGVGANLSASVASSDNATCGGRITLTSGTAVTTSDVTAGTSVYFTPYKGNRCALYDGASTWTITSFSELSLSLGSDAADTNYDLFLYLSGGNPTLSRVAWTNGTTRATNLALQNGVYVLSSDTTKRYLGTYRTTATIGQTEDSLTKRFVWNYYNRASRILHVAEATNSWTYTTSTFRQANNSTANQVAAVIGVAEIVVPMALSAAVSNTSTGVAVAAGIGMDTTSNPTGGSSIGSGVTLLADLVVMIYSLHTFTPTVGYHYFAWLEYSTATGTTTWYGDNSNGLLLQSGLSGRIEG